ncbi:MAG: hypothetical protein AAF961_12685 [Planctomycetota bacterium]
MLRELAVSDQLFVGRGASEIIAEIRLANTLAVTTLASPNQCALQIRNSAQPHGDEAFDILTPSR